MAFLFAICALLGAASSYAATVPAPPEFAEVRRYVVEELGRAAAPALSIAVVRDGKLVWAEGFGKADLERGRAATADSIYLLASVSKPLTATGLMTLVDRGLIDLDKPANAYLPGAKLRSFAGSADAITIRRMANHTSGMPTHFTFFYDGTAPPAWDTTIARYGFAFRKPGMAVEYSNLAFGLLGYIIETVGRAPLGAYMEKHVFDPLKMTRTSDRVRKGREADATVQYATDAGGRWLRVPPYRFDHPAASTFWSSAPDLARFACMHMNDGELDGARVLRPETARAMRTASPEATEAAKREPAGNRYGISWGLEPFQGEPCIAHTGGMPGVATVVRAFPARRGAVVLLTNSDNRGFVTEAGGRLSRALLGMQAEPQRQPPRPPQAPPAKTVGKWRGRWAHFEGDIPLLLSIAADGSIEARAAGREPVKLRDTAFGEATVAGAAEMLVRTRDDYHGIPTVRFRLWREGSRLSGFAMASAPGYFGLSSFVTLEREP